jgi:integrase
MSGPVLPVSKKGGSFMNELVRLRTRPSRDGRTFTYRLEYTDEDGKRRRISLGHADKRKAERQRAQKERELRMGIVAPESMKLSDFTADSLIRTGNQIRQSTCSEYESAMIDFVSVIGNIDYQKVTLRHGEQYRQACLDRGNSPATVAKKLRHLQRLFQLAIDRKQLDEHPLKQVKPPRSPNKKIDIYTPDECLRILKVARDCQTENTVNWELLILVALATGMRRAELLNATWKDVNFDKMTIEVNPKEDRKETWLWYVKDTDRRILPLTDEITVMLADHQSRQPEGYPYVFVPPHRYDHIQGLRKHGKWTLSDSRLKVINNFGLRFGKILAKASVRKLKFHDFRNTALSNWFAQGMKEYEVMKLAGHSSFSTTHKFYLVVADDLVDRARQATEKALGKSLAHIWHAPHLAGDIKKRQPNVKA